MVQRVLKDEMTTMSNITNTDSPLFGLGKKAPQDIGAAFAVLSVFIASLGVSLLSYTYTVFAARPAKNSDNATIALFFISVILSGAATVEFAALQLSGTDSPAAGSAGDSNNPATRTTGSAPRDGERAENVQPQPESRGGGEDTEKGPAAADTTSKRWTSDLKEATDITSTSVVLLYLSCATLFAGIFTFIWANLSRPVAISVSVVSGVLCIRPLLFAFSAIF